MTLTLQAIVVKKPIKLSDAMQEANKFLKSPHKGYYRETSESFRIRAMAKTKFEPDSFVTKVISPQVSLVLGKLKKV